MRPVDAAISHRRLKDFMAFYVKKSTVPLESRETFTKAYYRNTTFRPQAACLIKRSIQSTLRTSPVDIGDNINELTRLHIEQFGFKVMVNITRTRKSTSISGTLQNLWSTNGDNRELFEYVADHMLADASVAADWRAEGNTMAEVTRHQLERVVKTFCKPEIARHMIAMTWLFRNDEDELDPSVLPDDELLREYVNWDEVRRWRLLSGIGLDTVSKNAWIFQ